MATSILIGAFALFACSEVEEETASTSSSVNSADKRIVVSLADQRARAYEGGRCVRDFPVSTGKVTSDYSFETTLHGSARYYDFPILEKKKVVRMRSPFPGISYDQDVYNTIKLTDWGIYFHEANWTKTGLGESDVTTGDCGHCGNTTYAPHGFSHGCVNERHDDAVWLFDWAPAPDPTKKVVHITNDKLPIESCTTRVVSAGSDAGTSPPPPPPPPNPDQVTDLTREECLAHPTHCLEDLRNAAGEYDGRWTCWRSGSRATTGRLCKDGRWL